MSDNKMKANQIIENYLDNYLPKDDTQYATLLTGKWGCGKTHFIKSYITKHKEDYKFVYVSLFGLKSIDEVNELIFSQLHPVLGSKPAKLVTGLFKSAVKIGIPIADVTTIDIEPSNFNFFQQDNYNNSIFVFDDLERSFISYDEILGFINNLTEHNSLKVILVANTEEINEENSGIFDSFKEKVISRTFVVQNDNDGFWEFYYKKYPNLIAFSDEILDIFQNYAENNFRLLIQATDDYLDFIENFKDTEFLKNDEFKQMLIKHFLSFCITYKKSNNFDELKSVFFNGKFDHIFYEKFILPIEIWKDILVENRIDIDLILEKFGDLVIFKPLKEKESWVKLWYYWDLTSDEFYEVIDDVKKEFNNLNYNRLDILQHVYSLLILFIKNNVIQDLTVQEVHATIDEYLSKDINNSNWLSHRLGDRWSNGTGLGFQNQDDEDVISLREKLSKKMEEQKQCNEEKYFKNYLGEILLSIKQGNSGDLLNLLMENECNPVMNKIDHQKIFEVLKSNPQSIQTLYVAFDSRYATNYTINDKTRAKWLIDEKPFVEQLIAFLQNLEKDEQIDKFYRFRIGQYVGFFKNDILPRFDT